MVAHNRGELQLVKCLSMWILSGKWTEVKIDSLTTEGVLQFSSPFVSWLLCHAFLLSLPLLFFFHFLSLSFTLHAIPSWSKWWRQVPSVGKQQPADQRGNQGRRGCVSLWSQRWGTRRDRLCGHSCGGQWWVVLPFCLQTQSKKSKIKICYTVNSVLWIWWGYVKKKSYQKPALNCSIDINEFLWYKWGKLSSL